MGDELAVDRLVQRAQQGDREAFRSLVLDLQQEVFSYLCARAPNLALAEEVLQNTFVTAWQKLDRYELRGLFLGWLKGIAHNQLRQELRRLRRHSEVDPDSLDQVLLAAAEADTERSVEAVDALGQCLEELPPRARDLLERRYFMNHSVDDLAAELGRKASTLAVTFYRLRNTLRTCIERRETRA